MDEAGWGFLFLASPAWVLLSLHPLLDSCLSELSFSTNPVSTVVLCRDISIQKQTQEIAKMGFFGKKKQNVVVTTTEYSPYTPDSPEFFKNNRSSGYSSLALTDLEKKDAVSLTSDMTT